MVNVKKFNYFWIILLIIILILTSYFILANFHQKDPTSQDEINTPKEKIICPDEVSLVLTSYQCSINSQQLSFTLSNKGRFTIDGIYIRINNKQINIDQEQENSLKPGVEQVYFYNTSSQTDIKQSGNYSLEIQPAIIDKNTNKLVACNSFIKNIACQ